MSHQVFNWQLNRKMGYWYPEARPTRQIGYLFDINKCIACQTCTLACKTTWTSGRGQEVMLWNNVETKPYGFYPTAWDVRLLNQLGGQQWGEDEYEGQTIFEAAPKGERMLGFRPEDEDWCYPNLGEDEVSEPIDGGAHLKGLQTSWMFYLARICNHCTYPACLAGCPRMAIYKRREDGIVLLDQANCRGHRECVRACPYKKVFFNVVTGVSEKCIGCYPKIESGDQPQCVTHCIGKIRLQGFVNTPEKAREDNPIDYLIHIRKVALPLYPQFGLEPNVYYMPPVHVSRKFLKMMFGPGVEQAIETYRTAKDDPKLLGAMLLFGSTERTLHSYRVRDGAALGFDEKGAEVVRVPLKEPVYVRPYHDEARGVYRHNTP